MPLHDYECRNCRSVFEAFTTNSAASLPCVKCGTAASKVFLSAPRGFVQMDVRYDCPITGKHITNAQAHRENLARHGCRVLEGGEREAAERWRRSEDEKIDREIGETVERELETMPGDKREQLGKEIESGASAEYARV